MLLRLFVFLIINFAVLAVGGFFSGKGVASDWYSNLNKAPWTPPGWAFGAAWTIVMVCFSAYMAYLWPKVEQKNILLALFTAQLLLNLSWNPAFFHFKFIGMGLFIICGLTMVVSFIMLNYWWHLEFKSFLVILAHYCYHFKCLHFH